MLGVMLRVCNTVYYLCPCCITLRLWCGDGNDLAPCSQLRPGDATCDCAKWNSAKHTMAADVLPAAHPTPDVQRHGVAHIPTGCDVRCTVCKSKHVKHPVICVPDICNRSMRWMYLCNRHHPPAHIMKNVWGYQQLMQTVRVSRFPAAMTYKSKFHPLPSSPLLRVTTNLSTCRTTHGPAAAVDGAAD